VSESEGRCRVRAYPRKKPPDFSADADLNPKCRSRTSFSGGTFHPTASGATVIRVRRVKTIPLFACPRLVNAVNRGNACATCRTVPAYTVRTGERDGRGFFVVDSRDASAGHFKSVRKCRATDGTRTSQTNTSHTRQPIDSNVSPSAHSKRVSSERIPPRHGAAFTRARGRRAHFRGTTKR